MNNSPINTDFRVDQIDHVELFVPDRHQAAEWYRSVLGLERLSQYEHWADDPRGPLMISSDAGHTKVALFQGYIPRFERDGWFSPGGVPSRGGGIQTLLGKAA